MTETVTSFEEATRESAAVELEDAVETAASGAPGPDAAVSFDAGYEAGRLAAAEEAARLAAETAADEEAARLAAETAAAEQLPRETGDDTSAGSADDVVVAPVDAPVAPETGVEDADQAG